MIIILCNIDQKFYLLKLWQGQVTSSRQNLSMLIDLTYGVTSTKRVAVTYVTDIIIYDVFGVRSTTHTIALHICYIRGHHRNGRFLAH